MRIFLVLLSCIAFCSCVQKPVPRPNILFILSEDNGPDLGCYGVEKVHTPNIDQIAKEGLLFERAYVTYSVCSPSRGTIFTGLYPHQNGQVGLATHKYRMFDGIKTLPKYLGELGYRTACIGKVHVNPESDIPWDYRPEGLLASSNFGKKDMPGYAKNAVKFVQQSDDPYYLQVNFPDAHFPVQKSVEGLPTVEVNADDVKSALPFVGANSEYLQELTANYYNCMNRLDEAVGMLLDSLEQIGALDNTIIIYMSDHGAQFSRAKCSNYEAALRVPFIVKWDGKVKAGVRSDKLVSSVSLLPTFIDIAGGNVEDVLPGKSLVPLFLTPGQEWSSYVYAGGMGCTPRMHYPRRSVVGERYKLIRNFLYEEENPHYAFYQSRKGHFAGGSSAEEISVLDDDFARAYLTWKQPPEYELYDIENDPYELRNLSADETYNDILLQLKTVLTEWQVETKDAILNPEKLQMINDEVEYIKANYPNLSYRKDSTFHWDYIHYLK